jgi:hypothetical protein
MLNRSLAGERMAIRFGYCPDHATVRQATTWPSA